ncbi:MAG: InlB B-repeat-containing protein, partial [Erysipelotrichaceae bacterium]|nr:InlB B-repeat-containing protein [Erysipelotrichaceae bacterium]
YTISKAKITSTGVMLNSSYIYVKGGVKPQPVVVVDGKVLTLNTDYTLSYKNNAKVGTATVTVKGKGNYEGTVTKSFTVKTHGLSGLTITANDKLVSSKAAAMSTTITITDSNGQTLKAGTDYDKNIKYTYQDTGEVVKKTDIIPVDTIIRATVTLKGNYSGIISTTFRIVAKDISKATVTIPVQYYTGKAIYLRKEDMKVVVNKVTLSSDDFIIISYTNNKEKGTATVTIKGVGEYGGIKTVKFNIVQKSFGITVRFVPNANDTTGTMKDQLIYANKALIANTFKRSGYTFEGWSLTPDGSVAYSNKATFAYDEELAGTTVVLYAIWE